MLVYFFIAAFLLLSLIFVILSNNKALEFLLFVVTFIIFFIIAGFRTLEVGSDSYNYVSLYSSFEYGGYEPNIFEFFTARFEYGFLLLNKILYKISESYTLLFAFFSFATLLPIFYVVKKMSPNILLSLIIFFGYRIFTFSLSSIRAAFSIALCMLAFYYFVQNKRKFSFFTIIIASSFHLSSLLFVIILFFEFIKLNRKTIFFSIVLTIFAYLNLNIILNYFLIFFSRYSGYINSVESLTPNLATVLNFLVVLIVFLFGEKFLIDKSSPSIINLRKLMYLDVLISFIAINVPMLGRFVLLFGSLMMIYIPVIISQQNKYMNKFLMNFLVTFLFFLYFFVTLILKPEWNVIVPYQNVLFN